MKKTSPLFFWISFEGFSRECTQMNKSKQKTDNQNRSGSFLIRVVELRLPRSPFPSKPHVFAQMRKDGLPTAYHGF